jgi:replicative DNA helicase
MQLAAAAGRSGSGFDAEASVAAAVTALLALGEGRRSETEPQHVSDLVAGFVDYISDVYEGRVTAMSTGLHGLDDMTAGGGRTGELWVFGARPSMGKTGLTNTIARNMSRPDLASLFCSQEDSLNALMARHVASLGRVNLADLRNPKKAPDSMWNGLTEGVHNLSAVNLYLDAQGGLTLGDVRRKVQQTKRRAKQTGSKVGLIVVDYLQLMRGEGANRNIELGAIANGMKQLAKDEDVLVFLLSQMNREADKRLGPPVVSDLRDSGDIEGAADVIGLLWRPYVYWKADNLKRYAELLLAKQKNGQQGSVHLEFDGAYQRFIDWDGKVPSWQDAKSNRRLAAPSAGGMD